MRKGLPVPIVGSMAETAALFVAYSGFQDIIRSMTSQPRSEKLTIPELGVAAGFAGFATSFIMFVVWNPINLTPLIFTSTPIELVKCKMQVQMMNMPRQRLPPVGSLSAPLAPNRLFSLPPFSHKHVMAVSKNATPTQHHPHSTAAFRLPPGPLGVIRETVRAHGLRGLWIGHTGTLVRETGGTAAWFAIKEGVADMLIHKRKVQDASLSPLRTSSTVMTVNNAAELLPWESAISGAIAGGACVMVFYPADTVKSAMQTADELSASSSSAGRALAALKQGSTAKTSSQTFTGTFLRMYALHGLKGLYAGCGMTVARAVPSSGIIFVVYDGLTAWFG
ncbi:hypothetical protein H0H87_006081 [Tephrocybe sp. NHM501043]|nr:hypothetical protein H0H87_006081 [Tephrocybe sp. NHM501043]